MSSIAAIPAFASLNDRAVSDLARHARPVRYPAGAVVRPAGTVPDAVLLLLAGTVVAAYVGPSGGQTWTARWDGPAIVDKPSVLGGPAPSGALLATARSVGLLLSHGRFLGVLEEHEPVRRHVLRRLAADTLALRERLADATLPAVARVARWLLATGDWHGSQEDLARTLGLGRVTVNRALGRLARVAALRLTQGGVRIEDANRLAAYADHMTNRSPFP
jgi:CRP/FNR family transcriptional regulator, cyclic AMP receptor protein